MWRRAHNILMAPFSQQAMRGYLPRMVDIAGQLVDKWSRLNPDDEVNIPQDMTALTLDTIALCGFDYRFNSLYRDTPHPFVAAMVRNLAERQKQAKELPIQRKLRIQARRQDKEDQEFQVNLVKGLMADRRRLGRRRGQHRPARPDAHRRRQAERAGPAGRQHRRPVPHLPGRRVTRRPAGCCLSRSTS